MTEEIAATPGWTDSRLDSAFAVLPGTLLGSPAVAAARDTYEACLAGHKAPAAPSDLLGTEFAACRPPLRQALEQAGVDTATLVTFEQALEAVEAEIAAGS